MQINTSNDRDMPGIDLQQDELTAASQQVLTHSYYKCPFLPLLLETGEISQGRKGRLIRKKTRNISLGESESLKKTAGRQPGEGCA